MATQLVIRNDSNTDVTAYITLGATPGCCQEVSDLMISNGAAIYRLHALMGTFPLAAGAKVYIAAPNNLGLNGNFAFNTPPLNCPTPEWCEGVNLAEFIINNGFQVGGQETIDISCVCGANAFIEYELSTDDWNDGTTRGIKHVKNGTAFDNTNRSGVYPYGCDNCTASVAPPPCIGQHPEYASSTPICNVQRDAGNNKGGDVTVVFKGFTPQPA